MKSLLILKGLKSEAVVVEELTVQVEHTPEEFVAMCRLYGGSIKGLIDLVKEALPIYGQMMK